MAVPRSEEHGPVQFREVRDLIEKKVVELLKEVSKQDRVRARTRRPTTG
jgi:hypothetical protein